MKAFATLASVVLFAGSAFAQFMINTPTNAVLCQPVLLTWQGGVAPYFLSILPGGQPSAAPLEQFTGLTGTQFTWNVNLQAGQQVGLTLKDSTGATAQSAPFEINSGTDSSCLTSTASTTGTDTSAPVGTSAPATSPATSTPAATTPTTTPATTPVTTGATTHPASASTTSPGTSSKASTSPAPTKSTGAGVSNLASGAAAAAVGAFVAAVLA